MRMQGNAQIDIGRDQEKIRCEKTTLIVRFNVGIATLYEKISPLAWWELREVRKGVWLMVLFLVVSQVREEAIVQAEALHQV